MTEGIPLHMLVAPVLIALAAVAAMVGFSGAKAPGRLSGDLGYKPDPAQVLSLTLARYVGGHPDVAAPIAKPYVMLTHRHLAAFTRARGAKLFLVPWNKVEAVTLLDRAQMEAAAIAVRGLQAGAIEAAPAEARFARVRYQDERGWWQNVVLELSSELASEQADEIQRFWVAHRDESDPEPEKAPVTP